jgi:hypothetical protein
VTTEADDGQMTDQKGNQEADPNQTWSFETLARRFGPLFIIPGVLSILGELEDIMKFSGILATVLKNWVAFELLFWTSLIQPIADLFDIKLQQQFFRGVTIPALWTAFAIRLYFFAGNSVDATARTMLETRVRPPVATVLILLLIYVPTCFYIALNLEGLFDGYLAPDPIFPLAQGFWLILCALCLAWVVHFIVSQLIRPRTVNWPVFLFAFYILIIVVFAAHEMLYDWDLLEGQTVQGLTKQTVFGLDNLIEAPALYNFPLWARTAYFVILAVPIFFVGRRTGKPVLQLAVAVLFVLLFDYAAQITTSAYESL